eukprot:2727468-Amphidinium_carterae.1
MSSNGAREIKQVAKNCADGSMPIRKVVQVASPPADDAHELRPQMKAPEVTPPPQWDRVMCLHCRDSLIKSICNWIVLLELACGKL